MIKYLVRFLVSPITRTVLGIAALCGSLICRQFEQSKGFGTPLFILALVLTLFPITATTVFFKKSKAFYDCDKCGKGDAVTAIIVHQLVCILLPFIRIPYRIERRIACKKCYLIEKEGHSRYERLLLLKTGIIRNKKRKKGRCN